VTLAEILINLHFDPSFRTETPSRLPLEFHRRFHGYRPTPFVALRNLAERFNVAEVYLKDESNRFGLPAFKILGALWAIFNVLRERLKIKVENCNSLMDLCEMVGRKHSLSLVCATDGNHGRAVARVGRMIGIPVTVHVPEYTSEERVDRIEGEGAIVVMGGSYDDAVKRAAQDADKGAVLIQDTAWEGYEKVPGWTVEGYSTLFWEVEDEIGQKSLSFPTHVVVQMGVGSFAKAAVHHFRRNDLGDQPVIVGVEPLKSGCVFESMKAGRVVHLKGRQDSIMAGLNAGTMSTISFDILQKGANGFLLIDDERAREAMCVLAQEGFVSGETGAAGLAGLLELMDERNIEMRTQLGIGGQSRVMLISTEGATDRQSYEEIVGRRVP